MSILEESKLNQLKTKFSELDFKDPKFTEKAQEIINEALKGNLDKIGKFAETKTIDEAFKEEEEGFEELKKLQEEGILSDLEDKDLENELKKLAEEGIKDETAEKLSLEQEGFITEKMKKTTPEDMLEEIIKQLEEVIEEKKKELDRKIEENEAMRQKVVAREKIRASRIRVNNLHQKTKDYKGTQGKKLNQNIEAAIADFDKQLEQLTIATTRDGVEMTDAILDEQNKQFEEEKKSLEDMLKGLRNSYKEENAKKLKLVMIEKQVDDVVSGITSGMKPEELYEKANALGNIFTENREQYEEEIRKMFANKEVTVKKEAVIGEGEDVSIPVYDIVNLRIMSDLRRIYMSHTGKEEKTEDDEKSIDASKKLFEKSKHALKLICGNDRDELPLMTEKEYIEQFEGFEKSAEEKGFFGKGMRANKIAKEMQKIYNTLAPFIGEIKTNGILPAYQKVTEILKNNKSVLKQNLPPLVLLKEKKEEKTKIPNLQRVETPIPEGEKIEISEMETALTKEAENIIEEAAASETEYGED